MTIGPDDFGGSDFDDGFETGWQRAGRDDLCSEIVEAVRCAGRLSMPELSSIIRSFDTVSVRRAVELLVDRGELEFMSDMKLRCTRRPRTQQTPSAVMTIAGTYFDPLNPNAADVDLQDIDHALNRIVRFNGHTRRTITVAEHSLRVRRFVQRDGGSLGEQLLALLHDAAEAYVGDVVRPVKTHDMRAIEVTVLSAIIKRVKQQFNIVLPADTGWARVHEADSLALFFEAMLEQPNASDWAPKLSIDHAAVWRYLPDVSPRPGESWLAEVIACCNAIRESQ